MLHVRDMVPPVREQIEEHELQVVSSAVEDVYQRDEKTGVLLLVGKTEPTNVLQMTPTGNLVESFTTPGEGDAVIVHEGSLKQVDLTCADCGSLLQPGNDSPFYYLLCSRLNERAHDKTAWVAYRTDEEGKQQPVVMVRTLPCEPLYENCVLECGNAKLGEPD